MSDSSSQPSAATRPAECWTRVELAERGFLKKCAEHTDGVVIPARFDSAPLLRRTDGVLMEGSHKATALVNRIPFLIDPETWRLPFITSRTDADFKRDLTTLAAQAVPLPLTATALANDALLLALVRATVTAQAGAKRSYAPDFQFRSLDDPWLAVNLRALELTCEIVGGLPVGAWIHVTLETLLEGELPYLAERYAAKLAPAASLVLTVSDLHPTVTPEQLAAYFQALTAFEASGLHVTIDRAGDFTIPAVAEYASGCMLGNRIYRTAPSTPRFTSELNSVGKLKYFVGDEGRRVPRQDAKKRHSAGRLAPCPRADCDAVAVTEERGNLKLRLHAAHELRGTIRRVRALSTAERMRRWRDSKLKPQRDWAQAIELASARSEEA